MIIAKIMTITSFNHYHMVVLKIDGAYLSV